MQSGGRDQGFQGQTAVMSMWYATCVVLRMEEEAEPKEFEELHEESTVLSKKITETSGIARTQRWRTKTWIPSAPNNLRGQHGHQDGVRRGHAEIYCSTLARTEHAWLAHCGITPGDGGP